ncbi:class I SAM-dependent methyltransferase [Streptomyces sp. NPDC019396]|uniref:class I SAM-dependent methyltransferase n=1 Tax=Streptomyces sp. NPDC019396 TaxID=3154687 RepID=UPI0033F68F5C
MSSHRHHHQDHRDHHGSSGRGGHTADIDWDALAPVLESGAEMHRPLSARAAAWVSEQLPARDVRRVFDIGSGPGVLTCLLAEAFPEAEVVAVDATPQLLDRALARAARHGLGERVRVHVAEAPGGLDELGAADLIWAGNSVHHMGDQRAAIGVFAGRLRPGGLLAVLEGGLPARHLPRDIGIGRPGLEARIDAASSSWFEEMRAALPGYKAEVEHWPALLAASGLTDARSRSFLLDIPAPLTAAQREQLASAFSWLRSVVEGRLDGDDLAVLDRLLDPADEQGFMHRPDPFLLAARTVHTARSSGGR